MENALLQVYKKELEKYKKEHYIYRKRLENYEKLNIPPTEEEKNNEILNNAFKDAYEEEQIKINNDNKKVEILLNRLLKPNITPYLDDVIRHLENLINKIENN